MVRCCRTWIVLVAVGLLTLSGSRVWADINLELRALPQACGTRTLGIELYAVSDDLTSQSIAAMDVILTWDPSILQLQGTDPTGPYPYAWLFSGFSNDHGLDGLNDTWNDGNALYTAWAKLGGAPAYATPAGLLVTRFKFRSTGIGFPTTVLILPAFGLYTHTVVYDGFVPGLDVTGTLTGVTAIPSAAGDTNCDGHVNFDDINPFVTALVSQAAYEAQYPDCNYLNADCNCDGSVNFDDINPFVTLLVAG
jgi:hypothetical protein